VLPRRGKVSFSAACAQLLLPLYLVHGQRLGISDGGSAILRQALDSCWDAGGGLDFDPPPLISAVEPLIPTDEGDWKWQYGLVRLPADVKTSQRPGIDGISTACQRWRPQQPARLRPSQTASARA